MFGFGGFGFSVEVLQKRPKNLVLFQKSYMVLEHRSCREEALPSSSRACIALQGSGCMDHVVGFGCFKDTTWVLRRVLKDACV